jgi:hypothetical protein
MYPTVWVAIFGWPLLAIIFFRLWSVPTAAAVTLTAGYLLLPEVAEIDLPVLPPINKDTIPAVSVLLLVWLSSLKPAAAGEMLPGWVPRDKGILALIGLMMIGAFGTTFTNMDTVQNGSLRQAGLRLYDAFSIGLGLAVMLIPFIIARKVMATAKAQRALIVILIGGAVIYALLALWEVRMSPQLNRQLYGFFPHSWVQHERAGGFRPIIFLEHGLFVGIYFASALLLALGMARIESGRNRAIYVGAVLFLLVAIFASKVIGAFFIVLVLMPVVIFMPQRMQLLAAFGIALIVMTYPVLRNIDVIPTTQAVALAEKVSPARAESLAYRFRNEDRLLARAKQRPLFGWGGWGRNRVYNELGEDISVTDGRWAVLFGQGGWVRYLSEFGLLLWGILWLPFISRERFDPITVVLAVALIGNLIDLLPNSGVSVITWLMAGALAGRLEMRRSVDDAAPAEVAPDRSLRYARFPGPAAVASRPAGPVYRRSPAAEAEPAERKPIFSRRPSHDR